jgi:hypothetical protein
MYVDVVVQIAEMCPGLGRRNDMKKTKKGIIAKLERMPEFAGHENTMNMSLIPHQSDLPFLGNPF